MTVRFPAVAGAFYEGSPGALRAQIQKCFAHAIGPGKRPEASKKRNVRRLKALVVPHAGFAYSGPVAAHAYAALAAEGFPDLFLIFGPNHHRGFQGGVATSRQDWETPLGAVAVDEKLQRAVTKGIIEVNDGVQRDEHSIEVQLPFLQMLAPPGTRVAFVPVCMGLQDYEVSERAGRIVAEAIKADGRDVLIIASTDFTHVGYNYGQMPPNGTSCGEFARAQDAIALERILALDPGGLALAVQQHDITMCGPGPAMAALTAANALGARKARLLKYANSADVTGDRGLAVGYGAVAIE